MLWVYTFPENLVQTYKPASHNNKLYYTITIQIKHLS